MNVNELIDSGASISINYHRCENLNEAYNKIPPSKRLGKVELYGRNGTYWAKIRTREIEVIAFYSDKAKK